MPTMVDLGEIKLNDLEEAMKKKAATLHRADPSDYDQPCEMYQSAPAIDGTPYETLKCVGTCQRDASGRVVGSCKRMIVATEVRDSDDDTYHVGVFCTCLSYKDFAELIKTVESIAGAEDLATLVLTDEQRELLAKLRLRILDVPR